MAAYAYFSMARAPLGERLPADGIVHRNHALIDRLVREAEASYVARATALGVAATFAPGGA